VPIKWCCKGKFPVVKKIIIVKPKVERPDVTPELFPCRYKVLTWFCKKSRVQLETQIEYMLLGI
jgi:hypothetical protein